MLTHKQLRAQALGRAEVRAEFDKLADEFALLDKFLKAQANTLLGPRRVRLRPETGTPSQSH